MAGYPDVSRGVGSLVNCVACDFSVQAAVRLGVWSGLGC